MNEQHNPSRRRHVAFTILGRLTLAAVLGLAIAGGLIWGSILQVPNHLNPFAPLRVADDVNWLTRYKLSRLERDGSQCRSVLAASSLSHRSVPDRDLADGCGLSSAVEVTDASIDLSRSFTATCPLAVAWALFEKNVIVSAAREYLGQEVVRVLHFGTYACRNINHRERGRRSEHATANAIDISGFVLADGQQITLRSDWNGNNRRRVTFLRAVRNGACEFFDVVLSPDYNAAHHDHFHFDMGRYRVCQ
ncbi:extensin-like domain-containing protein [Microvirga sp. P5_D2]